MNKINKVLTTVTYPETQMKELRDMFPESEFIQADIRDTETICRELKDTDVAILCGDMDARFLGESSLKWIHCDHAGLALSAKPEVFEKGIRLSGSSGRSAPVLAEHVLYFMFQHSYHTKELLEAQKAHKWGVKGMNSWRGLYGATAGIIGMGNNGKMTAERMNALGMDIISYDRYDVEGFDYIVKKLNSSKGDSLDELLEKSDYIILTMALTDDTYKLFNSEMFAKVKKGAFLINMARGELVDNDALLEALNNGTLSGAGLDVYDPEPMPGDCPLWDMEQVYITPHVTPQVPDRAERSLQIIRENVRRYQEGEKLLNEVTAEDIFTKKKMFGMK